MKTIKQYPDDLFVSVTTGGGLDENGYPIPPAKEWVFHAKCRERAAGAGNIVATESGDITSYSSKVVMPLGTTKVKANTKIMIKKGDEIILIGNVIRFSDSPQLHCRLWV